jgi:hypothetical protein
MTFYKQKDLLKSKKALYCEFSYTIIVTHYTQIVTHYTQ